MTATAVPSLTRNRDIWTRLVISPIAGPFGRAISSLPWVTPNRVTATAGLVGLGSAACFATGQLRVGGVLFLLRFFFDVVDGVVARTQGTSSARGAALDLVADVAGIALNFAAISWYLARTSAVPEFLPFLLLAAVVFYNWILAYRKGLAAAYGMGDGGVMGRVGGSRIPIVSAWIAFSTRINMSPVPWAVEAETVALGLGPLLLPPRWVWLGLAVALGFYLLADLVNVRRVFAVIKNAEEA